MKKYIIFIVLILIAGLVLVYPFKSKSVDDNKTLSQDEVIETEIEAEKPKVGLDNPASTNCVENGGILEIITNIDGSQFGLCKFEDYSCEEWAYLRGECNIEQDTEKIRQALIEKGLDLSGMKVVIFKHLGKYIEAGVVPVSAPAGGGYVFAVKEDDEIKIVADGNGAIMCTSFEDYPEYPSYLIPECIDELGNPVAR